MNNRQARTRAMALSAILCALGVVILYLGSIITVLDLTATAAASIVVVFAVIELQGIYPYLIYIVTAVLSMLLLPNKFIGFMYLLFGGIYPIVKSKFEKINLIAAWVLKFSFFNLSLSFMIFIMVYIIGMPDTGLAFSLPVILGGNAVFLLYDIALSKLILFYIVRLRGIIKFKKIK